MTLVALALGLSLSVIDHSFFYHGYAACVSIAMVFVTKVKQLIQASSSIVSFCASSSFLKTLLADLYIARSAQRP